MDIIPVIELKSGKSARATIVRHDLPDYKRDDVLSIAKRWRDEGAQRLHIHDTDAARVGMPQNRDEVRDIVRRIGLPVQYSGGVRTVDVAERVLNWGVDRVVADAEATLDLTIQPGLQRLGGRVALELQHFNERIPHPGAPKGAWLDLYEFIKQTNLTQGWPSYICRHILGDGMLAAPDAQVIAKFMATAKKKVGVYARVRTWAEARIVMASGAESFLIGEALYDGSLALPDLINQAKAYSDAAGAAPRVGLTQPPAAGMPPSRPGAPAPSARPPIPRPPGQRAPILPANSWPPKRDQDR